MPAASSPLETLLSGFSDAEVSTLVETRRDLHRHPELGFEEKRTAGIVARRLEALGLSPRTGVGRTGVTADPPSRSALRRASPDREGSPSIASAKEGRILLRADMDGLPLSEETGAPYASIVPGAMHACGHDGHVSINLAVAARLSGAPAAARVRYLFQPAEEGAGGARACEADGILEGVTAAFGLHLWNQLPVGKIGVNRGALMAAVDEFAIDVEGPGGHGAAPHETYDAIVAAARIVEALQTIVSREISPLDPAVVTVGSIHGGSAFNIIPKTVRLTGTARCFSENAHRALPEKMERIVRGTAEAAGVTARLEYKRVNRATVNNPDMADLVIGVARRLVGEENVETDTQTLGGEDMSVYLDRVPGCFFFVGSAPEGPHRPHHSPVFDIDERALAVGTAVFEAVAIEAAKRL
ncbi:MAG TPA: amidohydrolase [Thermoanaerobaculia bacterium]|nr:amidohydrolase [Thermoanaerobaculia bacterium]